MRCACCPTGFHAERLSQCVFVGGGRGGKLHILRLPALAHYVTLFHPGNILPHFADKAAGSEELSNLLRLPS